MRTTVTEENPDENRHSHAARRTRADRGSSPRSRAQEINFGIISTDKSAAIKSLWDPFIDDMQKQTGLKVNAFFATDYTGIIEAQRFNKVQVAWYGNKSAIEAVDRANGEVFAQFIDLHGTPGYYSYIITHKDSPLNSLDDMFKNGKSLSFGSGDPQSTSGTLVPGYYVFAQRGLEAKDVFKVMRPATHGVNLLAVLNKQVDVGHQQQRGARQAQAQGPGQAREVKILWTSPLIPRDPLVWRKDLPERHKKKIKDFVVGYGKDQREKDILKGMQQIAGFRASTDAQLIPIRQLELAKDKRARPRVTRRSRPRPRRAKLKDIDAKLAELAKQSEVTVGDHHPGRGARASGRGQADAGPGRRLGRVRRSCWRGPGRAPTCARWTCAKDSGNMARSSSRSSSRPTSGSGAVYLREMIVTLHIAVWGTVLAIVCAVPFGLLSSSNIVPVWVYQPVRRLMDACRAINEMVFAMLFIVAVGLGPFAGVLALWIHTTGTLAKLFSEAVEAIDPRPVEGVRATGASALEEIVYGVIPQVLPLWISYSLYRFESNVRSASVVGHGRRRRHRRHPLRGDPRLRVRADRAVMLIIIVFVTTIDLVSARIRKLFI